MGTWLNFTNENYNSSSKFVKFVVLIIINNYMGMENSLSKGNADD